MRLPGAPTLARYYTYQPAQENESTATPELARGEEIGKARKPSLSGGINGNVPSVRRGNVRRVTGAVTDAPLMPSLRLTVLRCFPLCRGGVVVLSACAPLASR